MKKSIATYLLLTLLVSRCALFTDEYKRNQPDPLTTKFNYAGIAEVTIISSTDSDGKAENLLVIQNVGRETIQGVDLVIDVFSDDTHSYENLVSSDRLLRSMTLESGEMDSVALRESINLISHKSDIELYLLKVNGIENHSAAGKYLGTYKTYKDNVAVTGGLTLATIDILGTLQARLQAVNEFNMVEGRITPDSSVFSNLKADEVLIKRIYTSLQADEAKLRIVFPVENDEADSTIVILQKQN